MTDRTPKPTYMPVRTNVFYIDHYEFDDWSVRNLDLSLADVGGIIRKACADYKSGDYAAVAELPFVRKVWPHRKPAAKRTAIPYWLRREVVESGPCVTCGTWDHITVDHKHPVSKGGTNDRDNLQPMCLPCNVRKFNHTPDELCEKESSGGRG